MSVHVELNQPGTTNTTFSLPRLILVEGADDQAVLARLIKHENLAGFSIFNMSGNTAWTTRIQTFQLEPTFVTSVKSVGLIKDADTDPKAAWDSCIGVLRNCGLPTPRTMATLAEGDPSVAVMIVPSMTRQGAIEDLCMDSLDEARLACVRNYFACLGNPKYAQTGSKGYMQAYLAGLPTAPRDLTVAASRRTLDQYLATSAFDELRAFLRALAV